MRVNEGGIKSNVFIAEANENISIASKLALF
jgi:hypothetical protein